MTIGERIKQIRKDAKLTQKEFGAAIDVQRLVVASWEQGQKQPGRARLYVIAERFKVNPQWLIDGTGDIYRADALNDATQDQLEIDVIKKLFDGLPDKYKKKILAALKEMIETGAAFPRIASNIIDISGKINGNVDISQNGEKDK